MKRTIKLLLQWIGSGLSLVVFIIVLKSCTADRISDPGTLAGLKRSQQLAFLSNANAEQKTIFYNFETLFVDVSELERNSQYRIEVGIPGDGCAPLFRRAVVISDPDGEIRALPIAFDFGFPAIDPAIPPGSYEVRVQGHNRNPNKNIVVPFEVRAETSPSPTVLPTDAAGVYNGGTVLPGGTLWVNGSGFAAGDDVDIYVVADKDVYNDGEALIDVSGGFESVKTETDGSLPLTKVWDGIAAPAGTALDLIVDIDQDGVFGQNIDALREARLPGVVVQNAPAVSDIITQLTYDATCQPKDLFGDNEIIMVKSLPLQQPLVPNADIAVYLVNHQDIWEDGDPLVSVSNETSHEMPNLECAREHTAGKPCFPIRHELNSPSLPPGNYDVVIDVGANHIYDKGTDILDGGSQIGLTIDGEIPEERTFASTDTDFIPFGGTTTTIYAKVILADDRPIPDVEVEFVIQKGPGTLSSNFATTDEDGIAVVTFTGDNNQGSETRVKVTFRNNTGDPRIGRTFNHFLSIWTTICLHNQGSLGSGD